MSSVQNKCKLKNIGIVNGAYHDNQRVKDRDNYQTEYISLNSIFVSRQNASKYFAFCRRVRQLIAFYGSERRARCERLTEVEKKYTDKIKETRGRNWRIYNNNGVTFLAEINRRSVSAQRFFN